MKRGRKCSSTRQTWINPHLTPETARKFNQLCNASGIRKEVLVRKAIESFLSALPATIQIELGKHDEPSAN